MHNLLLGRLSSHTPKIVKEKQETDSFWSILGGKQEYASHPRLQDDSNENPPRLFAISNATGARITQTELYNVVLNLTYTIFAFLLRRMIDRSRESPSFQKITWQIMFISNMPIFLHASSAEIPVHAELAYYSRKCLISGRSLLSHYKLTQERRLFASPMLKWQKLILLWKACQITRKQVIWKIRFMVISVGCN